MQAITPQRTILRKDAMKRRTGGFDDATYWRWERQGRFPKRIQLGGNSIGWYEDEIDAWASSRTRVEDAPPVRQPPPPAPRRRRTSTPTAA